MSRTKASWWLCAVLGMVLAGCGGNTVVETEAPPADLDLDKAATNEGLTGDVKIDGSSTVYPISEAAADKFGKGEGNDGVKITVGQSGTGGGFKRFTVGETDISDASRPIKKAEFDKCKENGVGFIEIPIAYDGLTFVVNRENTFLNELTVDQLKKIFRKGEEPKTWNEVNPEWPAEEISIYAPGTDSGTFDYFKEVIVGKEEGVSLRADMSTSEDDNVLVNGVAGSTTSIGFFGAAYYFENQDKLRAVKIQNPKTQAMVAPDAKTIESGEYAPFSRPLFIYVNQDALKKPEVKTFVEYYLANAGGLSKQVGYVPLPQAIYDSAKANLDAGTTGTHYLTAEGEKRSGAIGDVFKAENIVDIK